MKKEKAVGILLLVITAYMFVGLALAMVRYSHGVKPQKTDRERWPIYPQVELVKIGFPVREVPDDQNAAIEYDRAFDLYAGDPGTDDVFYYVVDNFWIKEAEVLVPWLEQNAATIAAFQEGAKKEDCKFRLLKDPEYPFWPRSSLSFLRTRGLTRLVLFDGKYLEHQNKHREALDLYLAVAKMGYHVSLSPPTFVEGMVGVFVTNMSADAIQSCVLRNRLDTETLTHLRERVDVLGSVLQNHDAIWAAEKAFAMAALDHCFEDRTERLLLVEDGWRGAARVLLMDLGPSLGFRPLSRSDTMAAFRRAWDAIDEWNEMPEHTAYAQGKKLSGKTEEEWRFWNLALSAIPSFDRARATFSRAKTTKAIISTVIALETHRNKSSDYPEALDELKRVLDEIPNDPFTNEPLKYRRTENGYIVYSVGQNLVDEGGKGDDIVARHPFPEPERFRPQ
jgi:tetratricopeptide (TPR) repeat protein